MSCVSIKYDHGRKVCHVVKDEAEYRALRDAPGNVRWLSEYVGGNEKAKAKLLQFNYSCMPEEGGALKGCKVESDTVGMDIDVHRNPEEGMEEFRARFDEMVNAVYARRENVGMLMMEYSVSAYAADGQKLGVHLVFRRHADMSQEENLQWASQVLGVEYDAGAKDITRVFFSTTSNGLIYLDPELFAYQGTAFQAALGDTTTPVTKCGFQPHLVTVTHRPSGCTAFQADSGKYAVGKADSGEETEDNNNNVKASNDTYNVKTGNNINNVKTEDNGKEKLSTDECVESEKEVCDECYLGIHYSRIIKKWWDVHYDGKEPIEGDRNTKIFELAVNLRNICGFDEELMMKVIPRYGGFPEEELRQTIRNAISEKRTQMPKRLRDVLNAIKVEMLREGDGSGIGNYGNGFGGFGSGGLGSKDIVKALEDSEQEDDLFIYNKVPKVVLQTMGIGDSIESVGNAMVMPALVAMCPCIGARATNVRLNVHGRYNSLNLISFIAGDAASNKGLVDDVVMAWMAEDIAEADGFNAQRKEWVRKKNAAKNKKDQPEQPECPKVWIPLNNTTANVAEEIEYLEGKHALSFTSEADSMTAKWKSGAGMEFSTMLRKAYDASAYDREAKSADATNVHIKNLRWNVVMAGTPDALYRAISNVTDGFQSRVAIARTPDNTYKALEDDPPVMSDLARTHIENVSALLPLMKGEIELPKLEQKGREWLESVRLESMKNDDKTMARQRMRIAVTAQRMVCCLMLASVAAKLVNNHGVEGAKRQLKSSNDLWRTMMQKAQTPSMLEMYDIIADSLMDSALYYFRSRIEAAVTSDKYQGVATIGTSRIRKGKNDSIYSMLKDEFTFDEAMHTATQVKGINATHETVRQMLKNWANKGLIEQTDVKMYSKLTINN